MVKRVLILTFILVFGIKIAVHAERGERFKRFREKLREMRQQRNSSDLTSYTHQNPENQNVPIKFNPVYSPLQLDCAQIHCPELLVSGDPYSTLPNGKASPFRGYADPSIRKDPDSDRLWMAYSWPFVEIGENLSPYQGSKKQFAQRARMKPGVENHLAYSDDEGKTWHFHSVLWGKTPGLSPSGQRGHTSHEVANLLPVSDEGKTIWYGARLDYFLPDAGGFRKRDPGSFRIRVMKADSPAELSNAEGVNLGSQKSDPSWGIDFDLISLTSEVDHCHLWNEPALYYEDSTLFLVLSCMSFTGKKPNMKKNDLVVFYTSPTGHPLQWDWQYAGRLFGYEKAMQLGAQRLTQIDIAKNREGALMAIVTPDIWNDERSDFVHMGCYAIELDSLVPPKVSRAADGDLVTLAYVFDSDLGPAGSAACTYDPYSETGVVMGKRIKEGIGLGSSYKDSKSNSANMSVSLHKTSVHP